MVDVDDRLQVALARYQQGDLLGAKEECLLLLEDDPSNAVALHMLGVLHLQLKDAKSAVEYFQSALNYSPKSIEWHFDLGNAFLQLGKYEHAIGVYKKVLANNPCHMFCLLNLGDAYSRVENYQEAIECFNSVLKTAPDYPLAHYNLGNINKNLGQYEQAIECYRSAINFSPNLFQAHFNLGNVFNEQRRFGEAEEHYQAAINIQPDYFPALFNLGSMLTEQGKIEEAISWLEKSLSLKPNDSIVIDRLDYARSRQVTEWHFPMLADLARNDAYQRAIKNAVNHETHVLDIGAGSGLLSMMAARAGASKITACEMVPAIAKTAREIFNLNGYADKINLLEKKSTQIDPIKDLEKKVDLIVSEIVDMGLLGEGVIPTLRHAKAQLATDNVKLIPQGAKVYAQLVELPQLRPAFPVKKVSDFDLSPFDRFRGGNSYKRIDLTKESYTPLSDIFDVLELDFYNLSKEISDSQPEISKLRRL